MNTELIRQLLLTNTSFGIPSPNLQHSRISQLRLTRSLTYRRFPTRERALVVAITRDGVLRIQQPVALVQMSWVHTGPVVALMQRPPGQLAAEVQLQGHAMRRVIDKRPATLALEVAVAALKRTLPLPALVWRALRKVCLEPLSDRQTAGLHKHHPRFLGTLVIPAAQTSCHSRSAAGFALADFAHALSFGTTQFRQLRKQTSCSMPERRAA